ncbi:Glutathione peroxidase [Halotydeus destructor]|nr:Glutathione peroxidase [Halotydeus destructor]
MHDQYFASGLRIIAFPCNQFGGQEPACGVDLEEFMRKKKVQFDVFDKIEVNGDNAHPLWKYMKHKVGGLMGNYIKWNFSKFLVNREGIPIKRYAPTTSPSDVEKDIIELL